MKNKRESAMYGTLIIVVSTLTDRRFKDKIMNIVFEVSWRTQTMTRRLEIMNDVGLFCRAWLFFSVHISADSCTLNLFYVISKLSCKIDQRELEKGSLNIQCLMCPSHDHNRIPVSEPGLLLGTMVCIPHVINGTYIVNTLFYIVNILQ